MAELQGILVDLDLCAGCYACEVACKQENYVPIGVRWIQVVTIGPKKVDGHMRMDYLPMMMEGCTCCEHRLSKGLRPRCVDNCPTQALEFCKNASELLSTLRSRRRLQVCKLKGEVSAFG
jgi:Fe-S-cluster-containing dehydrogenase component